MNFSIDPKDLNLQDAAGMQLVEVIRNLADESGTADYEDLENLPKINGVTLKGNKSSEDLNIVVDYEDLDNLPKINGVTLVGNKTTADLDITPTDAQVETAVDAWLDDNVAQETGYVLDSSLTMSNAAAPADKVGELKSEFDDVVDLKYNYFNPADALSGKYYGGDVGDTIVASDNTAYACCIIPVTAGKTYVLARSDFRWEELDEDNKILDRHGSTVAQTQLQVTPNATGVKKIAFSWIKDNAPIASYMVLDPGVSFSEYIQYPYSMTLKKDLLEASGVNAPAVYTVGQSGDFSKFTDALDALANDTSNKILYVQTGVYDIFDELGGKTYIESLDVSAGWRVANKVVPQNTTIIGIGNVALNFTPDDDEIVDYQHGWLMSPLCISGSCTIENITINASNCRYAVHIESADADDDANTANIIFRNVRATRTATTLMGDHQTIGTGIGFNAKWHFENCVFKGTGGSACFSVHTNAPLEDSSASISFDNCVFDTISGDVVNTKLLNFISQYLPSAITNYAYVNNCFVRGKIGTETSITNRQSYVVNVNGGTSYGLADAATQTSGYTINNYGNNIIT